MVRRAASSDKSVAMLPKAMSTAVMRFMEARYISPSGSTSM